MLFLQEVDSLSVMESSIHSLNVEGRPYLECPLPESVALVMATGIDWVPLESVCSVLVRNARECMFFVVVFKWLMIYYCSFGQCMGLKRLNLLERRAHTSTLEFFPI